MTAVICWSRKMRMVASSAGTTAANANHHMSLPTPMGFTTHVRSERVVYTVSGYNGLVTCRVRNSIYEQIDLTTLNCVTYNNVIFDNSPRSV